MASRYDLLVESLENQWDCLALESLRDPNFIADLELVEAELRSVCPTSSCLPENPPAIYL